MKILLTASEVVGFAKTGGLADVAGALPRALADRGHDCIVVLPFYRCARAARPAPQPTDHFFSVPVGGRSVRGRLWQTTLPGSKVATYLVEQPEFFDRDDAAEGRGLYQYSLANGSKRDYGDNASRFIFFSRAVLEALPRLGFWPDVVHANDWQTGLIPAYLREVYRHHADHYLRGRYARVRTLFTIHNIAYQGLFWALDLALTGLDAGLFNSRQLEYYGKLNYLKAGTVFADLLNTVSPTYAREIQTAEFGCGLEGVLAERRGDLFGIVNGVDYDIWSPENDKNLAERYSPENVTQGKALCKRALQRRFHLPERGDTPLFGVIARLVDQKGLDILMPAAQEMLKGDVQLVVLGEGDRTYHEQLRDLGKRHPDKVGLLLGFEEALAHQIEAGGDVFLMPSRFEPCGLNQMYSMRYGTPPLVRSTGGLADTVVDATPEALAAGRATGFSFVDYTPDALLAAVARALDLYRRPDDWLRLQRSAMRQDWSWGRCAGEYEMLYERLRSS